MFIQLTFGVYDISLLAVGSRPCKAGDCFPGFPVFASPKKTDKHVQILIRPGRHAQTEHFWTSSSEFLISVSWVIIQFLLHASNKPKSKDIKDRRLGKTSFPLIMKKESSINVKKCFRYGDLHLNVHTSNFVLRLEKELEQYFEFWTWPAISGKKNQGAHYIEASYWNFL